jgi:hypothetical protein
MVKFTIQQNKLLKKGRELFNVKNNSDLLAIGGAFYGKLNSIGVDSDDTVGAGIGTTISNKVRKGMKMKYNIDNLRDLTDKDGLAQLPYSNFIGPGTDMESALAAGPVSNGPASIKNTEGLSADAIARQHDIAYGEAAKSKYSKDEKYRMIQEADAWMIDQVKKLPDSKTKSVILKSLQAKYALEKTTGKLVYGGKFIPSNNKKWLEDNIDAIINNQTITGQFDTKIRSREDKIKENLAALKKEEDEKKAKEFEAKKPYSQADKSILGNDTPLYQYYEKVDYKTKNEKYQYVISFPKNPSIVVRPPVEYTDLKSIEDPSTGDMYIYRFPVHPIDDEGNYSIDGFENSVVLERDKKDGYAPVSYQPSLLTALIKISQNRFSFDILEIDKLKQYGFIDKKNLMNYQTNFKGIEVNRTVLPGAPSLDESKRIRFADRPAEVSPDVLLQRLKDSYQILKNIKLYNALTRSEKAKYRKSFKLALLGLIQLRPQLQDMTETFFRKDGRLVDQPDLNRNPVYSSSDFIGLIERTMAGPKVYLD